MVRFPQLTNNRRERELRRLVLGTRKWLFTWLDLGAERTADILSIVGTCIAHDVNPRAYLHLVAKLIVLGWPQSAYSGQPGRTFRRHLGSRSSPRGRVIGAQRRVDGQV